MSRCSDCSISVKPIVAFDIDGTLAEYHVALANHCWRYFGMKGRSGFWDGSGDYEDWLGLTSEQYREAKLAYRQGGFKRWAPRMPGLALLLGSVANAKTTGPGLEVWITTTRPWQRLDSVDPDTRFWLDKNFPVYDHLLYDDHKYHKLGELVDPERVILIVEDLPDMFSEAIDVFGPDVPLLIKRRHNQGVEAKHQAADLVDVAFSLFNKVRKGY